MTAMTRMVEVDGLPIQYMDMGRGETILYLHGAGGAPPAGALFVEELAKHHRLILPSRPGFDGTPPAHGGDTAGAAAAVVGAFLRHLGIGHSHVIGQSAGATVACWLALLHPELTKSLVLSAPSTFTVRPTQERGAAPTRSELDNLLYGAKPCWRYPPTEEDRDRIQRNAARYLSHLKLSDGNTALLARIGEIALPTLLLLGTGDRMILPGSGAPFQKLIASCHRVFIYGGAHELPISAGPEWVGLVREFIDRGEAFVVNGG